MDGEGRGLPPIYEEPIDKRPVVNELLREEDIVAQGMKIDKNGRVVYYEEPIEEESVVNKFSKDEDVFDQGIEIDKSGRVLVYEEPITNKPYLINQEEKDAIVEAAIQLLLEKNADTMMFRKYGKK